MTATWIYWKAVDVINAVNRALTQSQTEESYDLMCKVNEQLNKLSIYKASMIWRPFDPDDKSTWPEDGGEVLATASDWNDVLVLYFNRMKKAGIRT